MAHPPTFTTRNQFIVYCDESRHVRNRSNPYMGIGGLWVPYALKDELRTLLDTIADRHEIRGELKWQKVSERSLTGYMEIVDAFIAMADVRFRAIVVNHDSINYELFHRGDEELGFYSFYYHMLVKWIHSDTSYIIVLDHKINIRQGRYSALERRLKQSAPVSSDIRTVTVSDSRESRIAQLADILTGAVTAAWCETPPDTAKGRLQEHIARCVGKTSLKAESLSPTFGKFNIFKIELERPFGP